MRARSIVLCLIFFGAFLFSNCDFADDSSENEIRSEFFTVRVDSINAPAAIDASDTLSVQLLGTVGPNGCHGLSDVETNRTENMVAVEVIGQRVTGPVFCTGVIVELDSTLKIAPPFQQGTFTIRINQPDNSRFNETVTVR